MKLYSGQTNELRAFYIAFANTRREMLISLAVLFLITFTLSLVFYLIEHIVQPDVFDSYGSCLVWAYTRYIEGGDGVFEGAPVTVVGRAIAFLLGLIGIAIVAIPAGLIGSGFMDAIRGAVNANLDAIHTAIANDLYKQLGLEPRMIDHIDAYSIPSANGTVEKGYFYAYVNEDRAFANKTWAEVGEDGKLRRVIKSK